MKLLHFFVIMLIGLFNSHNVVICDEVEDAAFRPAQVKKKIRFRKEESHKFSGLKLKGRLKKPELGYIYKRKGIRQEKIINIPEDFNDEIIQGSGRF